jgi:hypothetical protein
MVSRNYYVLGTHYYDDKQRNMIDEMISREVISLHWSEDIDLNKYYSRPEKDISEYLKQKGQQPGACTALKKFMQLKPGDIVALKTWNLIDHRGTIVVNAYARVAQRKGYVYKWEPEGLGHLINVEYLKTGLELLASKIFLIRSWAKVINGKERRYHDTNNFPRS